MEYHSDRAAKINLVTTYVACPDTQTTAFSACMVGSSHSTTRHITKRGQSPRDGTTTHHRHNTITHHHHNTIATTQRVNNHHKLWKKDFSYISSF